MVIIYECVVFQNSRPTVTFDLYFTLDMKYKSFKA